VNGWRCTKPPSNASDSTTATCALIRRQLLAAEAFVLTSSSASDIVTTAMLANHALAQRLGCPAVRAGHTPAGTPTAAGGRAAAGGGRPGGGKPGCVTETGTDGTPCTVCPGAAPVCAPAECQSHMRADGVMCTTCVDAHGETSSDCPDESPMTCQSYLANSGLVCSSCKDRPGAMECLPAECTLIDRCLRCADPKGRVAIDCSIDYPALFAQGRSAGFGTSTPMGSCSLISGVPRVSGMTCHYPGENSCVASQDGDWHCLSCEYPDRSSSRTCMDASTPLPDPLEIRPVNLPAPGTCTVERDTDGSVLCATCTREDLSATTSCQHAQLPRCSGEVPALPDPSCVVPCRRDQGSLEHMCSSPRAASTNH
jgi:hypothetical protein